MNRILVTNPARRDLGRSQIRNVRYQILRRFCRRSLSLGLVLVSASVLVTGANQTVQNQPDARELKPGEPIERELSGGQTHTYRMTLAVGQYVRVVVEQRGIDVTVTVFEPNGQPSARLNLRRHGVEPVIWVTKTFGAYLIEVHPVKLDAPPGRYRIVLEEQRKAMPQDESRTATRRTAERLMEQGGQLKDQNTAESQAKAVEKYQEALSLWRAIGEWREQANTFTRLGVVYKDQRELQKALDFFQQALSMYQTNNDPFIGVAWSNIGVVYLAMLKPQEALNALNQALPLVRSAEYPEVEAATLGAIGAAYFVSGEYQEALHYLRQSLGLWQARRDSFGEAQTFRAMGAVYMALGENEVGLRYMEQSDSLLKTGAVPPVQDLSTKRRMAADVALGDGWRLSAQGTVESRHKAIERFQAALAIWRTLADRLYQALTLVSIGSVHVLLGEAPQAIDYLYEAHALFQAIGNAHQDALALSSLGEAYYLMGEYDNALDVLQQGLSLLQKVGDPYGEYETRYIIARVERDRGHFTEAQSQIETALELIESVRSKVVSQNLRTTFLAKVQRIYEFYIALLMQLHQREPANGHDAAALQTSERARARSLLELLIEARADIRQGVDPNLLERERTLQQQLSAKSERLTRLLGAKHTDEEAAAEKKEVDALVTAYQEVQGEIRAKSPKYAALIQPQPLGLKDIQQQVLDDDTMLLEYALGDERSFLWAVTPTSIRSYELPKRADIESVAKRVYDLLIERNKTTKGETRNQWARRGAQADQAYWPAAAVLSRMILGPVADQLGTKRLLIVSDGALQYIPFGALPKPVNSEQWTVDSRKTRTNCSLTTDHCPLIVDHEIVSLPSASALAVLRKELAGRATGNKTLAVLADPVFEMEDVRVKQRQLNANQNAAGSAPQAVPELRLISDMRRSVEESGFNGLTRLPWTRDEADAIASRLTVGQQFKALDFEASKPTVLNTDLSPYRVVHFATHGLLNSRHPELSGIVLSLVGDNAKPQDGFLRLHEVYNLKLNADLVVLSACQTALGQDIKGEGLVGLTRGFMYAGAARVVASLWNVRDEATATLMDRFYQAMLVHKQRPAAALRAAQLALWNKKETKSPYYWAAFIIQGEWK